MKTNRLYSFLLLLSAALGVSAESPKQEFRGAWLHTVYQGQYKKQTTAQNQAYLRNLLDSLQLTGVNAVIFQVRPQADAFYDSKLEPWSRFLTDDGAKPKPYWDPLQFMVEECHKRGMELHAWLNPYRVTTNAKQTLPKGHIYHKHPERFVRYDGKMYFNPGLPENREFIGKVVEDIVSRYDIDAIHFDDYFYPYPAKGKDFDDAAAFAKYGKGMARDDWRRHNVDLLIEELNTRIKKLKPWVRFGISPFGIWRNKTSDPRGSDTNGLQNYDALYADVLLWEEKGWIDYLLPQLYWELDHKAASSRILADWWDENSGHNRHLYIGQDVERCISKGELGEKVEISRSRQNVAGNCWWPGYSVTRNSGGVADSLANNLQKDIALVPPSSWLSSTPPAAPAKVSVEPGGVIAWQAPAPQGKIGDVTRFVIYRFDSPENIDVNDASAIIAVVPDMSFKTTEPGTYVVSALDRVNNESEPSVPVLIQ
mgnify:FL=1|jgi:uncharacterized lipoprotein YddW (UPF0748 family)